MRYPSPADERVLHERVVQRDPVASTDVFMTYMDRIVKILMQRLGCDEDAAHDSTVEVIFTYIHKPARYDPGKGRLFSYLMQAARHRVVDKRRSADARARRDQKYGSDFAQRARTPKEELEDLVEARLAMKRLVERGYLKNERDWDALRLILYGERSTESLAVALGLASLPRDELKRAVKRHRDRLMKLLGRFGKEDSDGES
ncbi:RNA polymerase sigma factor [Archangium sp.]|uniref:RNA polymerase sigma factor n=1 Tax=Archangium sp. TaxID=1872627 RepID=UPI002D467387|nr:sigma-70 family RNA polymerase sigma factor [Archangium sp.]HYO53214.1 sigma-70 family RNA polymerase sigma factor [Archangium sp.]